MIDIVLIGNKYADDDDDDDDDDATSPPISTYVHHRQLLLLSPKADKLTRFTVPRRIYFSLFHGRTRSPCL